MAKNNQAEENTEVKTPKMPKAKGSAGYKALILLLLVGMTVGGGYALQTIHTLKQELNDVKQALKSEVSNLTTRVANVENGQRGLSAAISATADSIDTVYERKMTQTRKELQEQVAQMVFGGKTSESEAAGAENKAEGTPMVEKVITIEREKTPQEVLLAAGAIIVRDMAENNLPIEYETEVLQILAKGNAQAMYYAATAQLYAKSGIKGKNMLQKEFDEIFATLNEPEAIAKPEEPKEVVPEEWPDKIWYWLKKSVLHKRKVKQPEFKAETDAVYELVHAGDFAKKKKKMRTDTKYTAVELPALKAWVAQVEDYLQFEGAMKSLIMNALANIRLKEMEH